MSRKNEYRENVLKSCQDFFEGHRDSRNRAKKSSPGQAKSKKCDIIAETGKVN